MDTRAPQKMEYPVEKYASLAVWVTGCVCLCVMLYVGVLKNNIFKLSFLTKAEDLKNANQKNIDNLLLKTGDIVFKDKTSFVVKTYRNQGIEETLPIEINIANEPQKLYNFILQKKTQQAKPAANNVREEDFSVKPIQKQ